jgi:anhydro-N-acetylmuramic acid kinase
MKGTYRVTGLMSGSSMDGVDLAFCEFSRDHSKWNFRILVADTLPYPATLRKKLEQACKWNRQEIGELDRELGIFYAGLLNEFHALHKLVPDLIASHGHTILHKPDEGITLQAGEGKIMSEKTGITVVNDFRSADVAQGGQGAPLVPVGDSLLFGDFDACINLGGFANISYDDDSRLRRAYDLCPANMALNWIAGLEGLAFDKGGSIAKEGQVDMNLLKTLNNLDYYALNPPKSLGREWFLERFLPEMERAGLTTGNLMATLVEHIAIQVASGVHDHNIDSVLLSGGGVQNQTLVERIRVHTKAHLEIPDMQLVQFKEALIFAILGLLRIQDKINCLASATGGKQDLSTGTVYRNNNKS